jgi:Protein of unknown function (DUF1553)/Protein of unknown function (DUF1549)/Planctomycete cytochrome C
MRRPLVGVVFLLAALPARAVEPDLFTTEVRPILARHCFKCHGPDDKARKAKLRLDQREIALRVLSPGKPDQSELLKRISSHDPAFMMPPPVAKSPITDAQRQVLRRWIEGGAGYTQHWAFVPPKRWDLPAVKQGNWPKNGVDNFILARLEAEGLSPSPEADRYTLVRRLYLDLIGVPPTIEEADAFIADNSAEAYEKLVDRLLQDPRYGERWARRWLDLARYADTNGYEKDRQRSIWPYRDWVIDALNADMPFDRFTIEQLAGDMLPNATEAQRIATGFHRNTMLNEEGGIDPLEFRFHAMTDRVATTGTVWLGLTLGCAQCHSHKFDPIPHRDYYRFFACLNNADEPLLDVHNPAVEKQRQEIQSKIDALMAELPKKLPAKELEKKFADWLARERPRTVPWQVLRPIEAKSNLPLLTIQDDDSVFVTGDQSKSDTYRLKYRLTAAATALRLEVLPDDRLPRHGPGRVYYEGAPGDFNLSNFAVLVGGTKVKIAKATHSFANGGNSAAFAIDDNLQTGWSIDGGQGRPHFAVFQFAEPLAAGEFELQMTFERYYASGLGRFSLTATTAKPPDARDATNEIEGLLLIPDGKLARGQRDQLLRHYLTTSPDLAKERQAIDQLRKQIPAFPTTLVMHERPPENPRPTFIHNRGEYMQPTEKVEAGALSVLNPPKISNRLELARWLVSPENPLVARVTVNRQWQAFFGTGIVRTLQDFGYTGEAPSHPELLDWLATEFIRQGWSMKLLHKLIVMSATYRQVSRVTPELLAKDAGNRLLARGPRVRLEAEMIRDSVLQASGLLSRKMHGPSVFPPQPASVTTEGTYGAIAWKASPGEDRYRRGLYTFTKRTAPFAAFAAFDGPSGESCIPRREVSNTPLQALTLLNDAAFTEAAQALGRDQAGPRKSTAKRAYLLFRKCLTRPPSADEATSLVRFLENQEKRFAAGELDAAKVAGPGVGNAAERAAWTSLARALFNLDEMIVKE